MTKKKQLLNFIKLRGKVSTGELCEWKARHRYDRAQRTCRENKDLIRCRPMTEEEKAHYKPTGSATYMYIWIGDNNIDYNATQAQVKDEIQYQTQPERLF